MLIPHLHFDGNCKEAIELYEKAFNTKADANSIDYADDGGKIYHASMKIHGTEVFLNDGLSHINSIFGNKNCTTHLIVTFNTADELLECYEILKKEEEDSPFREAPYSRLAGNFVDKFGVLWGFMVTD